MIKYVNGVRVEMTPDEIAAQKQEAREARARPVTREAVLDRLFPGIIAECINGLDVDDEEALRMQEHYPAFEDVVGQTVRKGFRFRYGGKLWAAAQGEMVIQAHYPPGPGMESLYTQVCESHTGAEDDPIPYEGNMVLELGKHYMQGGIVYRCIRDSGIALHHALADLVGSYVEAAYTVK